MLGLLIGFFGIMITFTRSIQRKIRDLNDNFKIDKKKSNVINKFRDAIRFHTDVKQ